MPVRKNRRKAGTLADVVDSLPARFREVQLQPDDGAMTSLMAYMLDLSEHLRGLRPLIDPRATIRDVPPTVEVMTAIGIPPAAWYRALLSA